MKQDTFFAAYNEMLALLYDGVSEYSSWQLFLERFNTLCEARDTSIIVISPTYRQAFYVLSTDHDPNIDEDYVRRSLESATFFNEIPAPVPTTINEMMSAQRFLESSLYRDFFSKIAVRYMLCQDVLRTRHVNIRMTSKRTSSQGQFSNEQKLLFGQVVEHVRRAMKLREQDYFNRFMRGFYDSTIDKMEIGYVLLDRTGQIALSNDHAEQMLREGVGLTVRDGALRRAPDTHGPDIGALVAKMVAEHETRRDPDHSEGFGIDDAYGRPVLSVVMKPLFEIQQVSYGPAVALYMTDCRMDTNPIDAGVIRQVYGFTRSESKLAALLARGESLSDAADELNVSIHTVRTHLRGIYAKLGINKQYKVAALLNRSAARLM